MTFIEIVFLVVFGLIPIGLVGLYFPKKFDELARGDEITNIPLLIIAAVYFCSSLFISLLSLIFPAVPSISFNYFLIGLLAFVASVLLRSTVRRFQLRKDFQIDLGREIFLIILGILNLFALLLSTMPFFISFIFRSERDIVYPAFVPLIILLLSSVFILHLGNMLSKTYITPEGISRFNATIPWRNVKGYYWEPPVRDKITLVIKVRNNMYLKVPTGRKEEIDNVLQTYTNPLSQPDKPQSLLQKLTS